MMKQRNNLFNWWVRRCHRNASLLAPRVNAIRPPSRSIESSKQVDCSGWLEFKIGGRAKSQAEVAFGHPPVKQILWKGGAEGSAGATSLSVALNRKVRRETWTGLTQTVKAGRRAARTRQLAAGIKPGPFRPITLSGKPQALRLDAVRAEVVAAYRGDSRERPTLFSQTKTPGAFDNAPEGSCVRIDAPAFDYDAQVSMDCQLWSAPEADCLTGWWPMNPLLGSPSECGSGPHDVAGEAVESLRSGLFGERQNLNRSGHHPAKQFAKAVEDNLFIDPRRF